MNEESAGMFLTGQTQQMPWDKSLWQKQKVFCKCFVSYRLVSPVDADEEEELCHEEADAQVLVNCVAVALQPTEEAEGEDADQEADKWKQDANPCDEVQEQVVDCIAVLRVKQ